MMRSTIMPALAGAFLAVASQATTVQPASNPSRGKLLFLQCAACHTMTPDAAGKVGPSLHGIYGTKAGSRPGFRYSAAMAGSATVWNDETLDAYIKKPEAVVPGNNMAFGGIASDANRRDLLAYLKQAAR